MVGLKPRPVLLPDALMELTDAFGKLASEFLRSALDLVEAHPRAFSKQAPFLPRKIQQPATHRGRDESKNPTDYTSRFGTRDTMHCTALVHDAKGSTIVIKWKLQNRTAELGRIEVQEDGEKRLTATSAPDPPEENPVGRGYFEWWLDGKMCWRIPFDVVES